MAPGYGTANVALAATPAVVSAFFSHIATWPQRHRKSRHAESTITAPTSIENLPGQQLRYEEGLHIVRSFLNYASMHGVEEVQDFTAQPVPVPHWVRKDVVTIPEGVIERAAEILTKHLKTYGNGKGIELVGGDKWWRVRGRELEAEWIEMSKDYARRKAQTALLRTAELATSDRPKTWAHLMGYGRPKAVRDGSGGDVQGDRVILYIHGGAFFFSSLDLHRYQIQRHARKAGARAFVPNYRLSPQYPFPCGLLDSLAAYLYLINPPEGITPIDPKDIILMGDSAGGGMCLSLLILIREMGLPMPCAASLVSPWVDLTHSMPSIMEWDGGDYIPSVGFHYRPSPAWPPIPANGVKVKMPDGEEKVIDEQIQLYCPNTLLTHPLVSPINNGSIGGLCPLYISCGSVELLRDEIIYFAHKAADPTAYPPAPGTLEEYPEQAALVNKYPPTKVHLQVFEGACHVATTLAWTRSAKHIFRGTANFNIWAFKEARKERGEPEAPSTEVLALQAKPDKPGVFTPTSAPSSRRASTDLNKAIIRARPTSVTNSLTASVPASITASEGESEPTTSESEDTHHPASRTSSWHRHHFDYIKVVGNEPPFGSGTMVAERVSTHGRITPMEPVEQIPAVDPAWAPKVGRIRGDGPIQTWLKKRAEWDERFGIQLKHWREVRATNRAAAEQHGFLTGTLQGENPPACALVSLADRRLAREVGRSVDEPPTTTNPGVALWMKIGEKADAEAEEGKKHSRKKSWVHEVSRRASQALGLDSKRSSREEKRKSADRKSGERKSHESEPRKSQDLRPPTEPRARRTSVASPPKLAVATMVPPIRVPSPPPSADPLADALSKLSGTTPNSATTALPSAHDTSSSAPASVTSTASYTTAEEDPEDFVPSELTPVSESAEKEAQPPTPAKAQVQPAPPEVHVQPAIPAQAQPQPQALAQ